MYDQAPMTTVVHLNWLLLHDGNQDIYGRWRYHVRRNVLLVGRHTGGKGPNNQWAHGEYIENPVNK